jgi:hypothetical protein
MMSYWNKIKRALKLGFAQKAYPEDPAPVRTTSVADRRRRNIEGQIVALDREIVDMKREIDLHQGSKRQVDTFDLRQRLIRARDFRYKAGLLQAELERSFPQSELMGEEIPDPVIESEPPPSVLEAIEQTPSKEVFSDQTKRAVFEKAARQLLGPSPAKRRAAIHALGKLNEPRCAPLLWAAMGFDDSALQAESLTALIELNDADAVGELERFVESPNHRLRLVALRGLYNQKNPAALSVCLKCLADTHPEIRRTAAAFLGSLSESNVAPVLATLLRDEDVEVRVAAAKALASISSEQTVYMLIRALEDEEVAVRTAAKNALVRTLSVPIDLDVNQEPGTMYAQIESLMKWWAEVRALGQPWRVPVLVKYGKPHFVSE